MTGNLKTKYNFFFLKPEVQALQEIFSRALIQDLSLGSIVGEMFQNAIGR